jgi:hypothetical protein
VRVRYISGAERHDGVTVKGALRQVEKAPYRNPGDVKRCVAGDNAKALVLSFPIGFVKTIKQVIPLSIRGLLNDDFLIGGLQFGYFFLPVVVENVLRF